jgi:ABC-type dipeptide/oligopeptide/nickel transport system permease component
LLFVALLVWLPFPALRGALRAVLLVFSITPVFILGYVLQTHGVLPYALTPGVVAAAVGILFVGDGNLAEVFLQLETEVRTLRNRDYIHAAALRGASPWKHMLPGLLLPLSSISAGKVAFLLGSVVIAERLFRVPGLGEASLAAAKDGDAVLLLTLTLFITGVVALVALARDLLEVAVDPRLRRSRQDGG